MRPLASRARKQLKAYVKSKNSRLLISRWDGRWATEDAKLSIGKALAGESRRRLMGPIANWLRSSSESPSLPQTNDSLSLDLALASLMIAVP